MDSGNILGVHDSGFRKVDSARQKRIVIEIVCPDCNMQPGLCCSTGVKSEQNALIDIIFKLYYDIGQ